ncbi:MAG: radical SAM protein [Magnetococcales bacterium]|nr:radical SAM protein [Magnetococcales bacterium]MBF0115352.1 radical SAM protein [Magnetococcales bacterium]
MTSLSSSLSSGEFQERLLASMAGRQYEAVIALATAFLADHPGDLLALYHLGMARLLSGGNLSALLPLREVLLTHHVAFLGGENRMALRAFTDFAIQFAHLVAHLLVKPDVEWVKSYDLALKIAEVGARQLGEGELWRQVEALQKTLIKGQSGAILFDSPKILQVEPTNHCNLDCSMCSRQEMTRQNGLLSLELWQHILQSWRNAHRLYEGQLIWHQNSFRFSVPYRGVVKFFFLGEPLLHKQLDQMIQMAVDKGVQIGVQTNGTLLNNPAVRRRLLASQLDHLAISIDGFDRASYETIRRGSQWQGVVEGIQALALERAEAGLQDRLTITVSTILSDEIRENGPQVRQFFAPLYGCVDEFHVIELIRRSSTRFVARDGQLIACHGDSSSDKHCHEPLYKMNVLWDGVATPCCYDVDAQLALGHVLEGGVDAVWQGERMRKLQEQAVRHTPTHALCVRCLA